MPASLGRSGDRLQGQLVVADLPLAFLPLLVSLSRGVEDVFVFGSRFLHEGVTFVLLCGQLAGEALTVTPDACQLDLDPLTVLAGRPGVFAGS